MNSRFLPFLAQLAEARLEGPVFNQYANGVSGALGRANAIRRANLRLYLEQLAAACPPILLVGEAPGYRGCRLTGIPFTSEAIILDDCRWPFGYDAGFRLTGESPKPTREATATMVWSVLDGRLPPPLLWNAWPFHPHHRARPMSNRRPLRDELRLGSRFLAELLLLFPVQAVAAIGQSATVALVDAGVQDFHVLRHPSHGGKAEFSAGLQRLFASTLA